MPGPESALNPPVGGYMAEQAAPLLSVKTRPPWRSRGIIQRPRLDAFLDLIRHRLLTLVIAPPGFGKTTAALSWVDALAGAAGWHVGRYLLGAHAIAFGLVAGSIG